MNAPRTLPTCDWCDPDLDIGTTDRLSGDPAMADRLARELRLESALRVALRGRRQPVPARRPVLLIAALASAACLAAALLWWVMRSDPRLPRLDGAVVAAGTAITAESPRLLRWSDGSAIRLHSGASVRVSQPDSGTRLHLQAGDLAAEIAPQAESQPFRISSPDALSEVVGTAFMLRRSAAGTRLEVQHGQVRLALPDGESLLASAGASGLALPDGSLLALPRPGRLLWRAQARELAAGMVEADAIAPAGGSVLLARSGAAPATVFGVQLKGDPLFAWQAEAELRFDYRCDGPVPWLGIWIRSPDPAGPNHYLALPSPHPGRWRSAQVPLRLITPRLGGSMPPDGAPVRWLHLQAGWASGATLRIANLRIETP